MVPDAETTRALVEPPVPLVPAYGQTDVPGLLADSIADRYADDELERRRARTERSIATAKGQSTSA